MKITILVKITIIKRLLITEITIIRTTEIVIMIRRIRIRIII